MKMRRFRRDAEANQALESAETWRGREHRKLEEKDQNGRLLTQAEAKNHGVTPEQVEPGGRVGASELCLQKVGALY